MQNPGKRVTDIIITTEKNMSEKLNLQDTFLNAMRKKNVAVSIYLVNGIKLQGTIDSFDNYVILLKSGVSQMIYKHAISTVVPSEIVKVTELKEAVKDHKDDQVDFDFD